ncbi:MAG: FAD-dependent oxidoreductase, partial [Panacagrimonas sp.]
NWADMSHLLPIERWPRGHKPKSIAYFCGPMAEDTAPAPYTDTGYPAREREKVRAHARQWVTQHLGTLWPSAGQPCWERMQSAQPCQGEAAFEAQYFRANIDPSERYVLSVPGSTRYRLRSDQSGFNNLFLAGDWTHNGINAGCVEAAVMSGMRAAAGLAKESIEIPGETDGAQGAARNEVRPPELVSLPAQNQSWPWSAMYGMAQTSGASALFALPRDIVQGMLEPGLTLAPQDLAPAGQHPVLLLFGWQSDVRPNRVPFGGGRYMEFIVSVPFVQHAHPRLHERCPGPFIYMPRLYLDQLFPTLLGIWGYGYNKTLATIQADQTDYTVYRRSTQSALISASYQATGATGAETDFPNFSLTRKPYALPLISRTRFGQWHYSFYDFALGQALIQPIEMTIKVYSREVGGLPPGTYTVPSIQKQGLGAFFITTDATISNPLQSAMLAEQIRARSIQGKPPLLPYKGA